MKMYEEHEMCGEVDSGSLYKIGMFAAMNRVTVKALRFYEERGLLLPVSGKSAPDGVFIRQTATRANK